MKKVALVSITLNAVGPMMEVSSQLPDIEIRNYLDSYLSEKIKSDGKIMDETMGRMLNLLTHACRDGADGIILTCSVFTPYVETFQKLLSIPVIGADFAMLKKVAETGGETVVLCTFKAALKPSEEMLKNLYRENNKANKLSVYWLEDAYEAAQKQNFKLHDELIQTKVREIDGTVENIVLAQISMANAVVGMSGNKSRIFTSPQAAFARILEIIRIREDGNE